jgi:hypothetical protein
MPKEIVEGVDTLVGRRARSKFITEATQEKLDRLRLIEAAKAAGGSLKDVDTPGWETPEAAAAWVHASRQAYQERLDRFLTKE